MKEEFLKTHWWSFKQSVAAVPVPKVFPYPFYYEPHEIAQIAAQQLQDYFAGKTVVA